VAGYIPHVLDRAVLWLLAPLAAAILLSGLDDLAIDLIWAFAWLKGKLRPAARLFPPGERQLDSAPQSRIAILVPLWHEHGVIASMLEHNLASIRYSRYDIFAGCYPNDPDTQNAVRAVSGRFPNVHLAVCPHDGPTSKADCLNWIFQHLRIEEENRGTRFEIVMTHDAEDMIHPEELRWTNYYAARFDFIQTPVLPLATPLRAFTHGLYCDEFAEYHTRDMTVRTLSGGFVPSSGVGTGYRRDALEKLARSSENRIFEPEALTEDYVNGLRLFRQGCTQTFIPIFQDKNGPIATREFFPQKARAALRQRTRWVTGIALQGWQQFGWSGKPGELYWLWRDRKGLLGNPLSLLSNLVFLYGLVTELWLRATPLQARLSVITLALQAVRTLVRAVCSARIYGLWFALGVPFRAVYANALNTAATFQAVRAYASARVRREPLRWLKTEHAYPSRAALLAHKRRLGEILVASGQLAPAVLKAAIETRPASLRLGDHLVASGALTRDAVYQALSFQQGLPLAAVDASAVPAAVARALPERVRKHWKVQPFRVADGSLFVASPEIPTLEMTRSLRRFTGLEIRFHLATPDAFESLVNALT
jgi:adsorption protein B